MKKMTSCLQGICSLLKEKKKIKCNSKQNKLPVIREVQMPCKYREGKDLFQFEGGQGSGKAF